MARAANDNASVKPEAVDRQTTPRACPICGKPATHAHRPFCSARCTDVDLHRWLGGAYAIPASDHPEEIEVDHPGDDGQMPHRG